MVGDASSINARHLERYTASVSKAGGNGGNGPTANAHFIFCQSLGLDERGVQTKQFEGETWSKWL